MTGLDQHTMDKPSKQSKGMGGVCCRQLFSFCHRQDIDDNLTAASRARYMEKRQWLVPVSGKNLTSY